LRTLEVVIIINLLIQTFFTISSVLLLLLPVCPFLLNGSQGMILIQISSKLISWPKLQPFPVITKPLHGPHTRRYIWWKLGYGAGGKINEILIQMAHTNGPSNSIRDLSLNSNLEKQKL